MKGKTKEEGERGGKEGKGRKVEWRGQQNEVWGKESLMKEENRRGKIFF